MSIDEQRKQTTSPDIKPKHNHRKSLLLLVPFFLILFQACSITITLPFISQEDAVNTAVARTLTPLAVEAQLTNNPLPTFPYILENTPTATITTTPTAMVETTPTATRNVTTTPSFTSSWSSTPEFTVTDVSLSVSPVSYSGVCPTAYIWTAVITVNGPGFVSFKWESEEGTYGTTQMLSYAYAGSRTVTMTEYLSAAAPDTIYWKRIHITAPNEMTTDKVSTTQTCDAEIDVRPARLYFGMLACGETANHNIVVENDSYGDLDISSVKISSGSTYFSIQSDACTGSSIQMGEHCVINVQFGPLEDCDSYGALYDGSLKIDSNDPDEGSVEVGLRAAQQ